MKRCNLCGGQSFLDQATRVLARCAQCGSLERHRALVQLIERLPQTQTAGRCLEIAPLNPEVYGVWLKRRGWKYVCTDKWRTGNPNDPRAVGFIDYEADLTDLFMFEDASFELVIVQHVIEEIPEYYRALAEIARVLTPAGVALLEIPYDPKRARSERTPANHFGNVWKFGQSLLDEMRTLFPKTEILPFEDGVFRGEILVAGKDQRVPQRPHPIQRVFMAHGHDVDFAGDLRLLLATLQGDAVRVLTPDEYLAGCPGALITFDDGHANDLQIGLPLLEEFDAHAISFLIPLRADLSPRIVDWQPWRDAAARIEVGAHSLTHSRIGTAATGEADLVTTVNHLGYLDHPLYGAEPNLAAREWLPHLGRLESDGEMEQRRAAEIGFARQYIERSLGRAVRFFSYPWGRWDALSVQTVRSAGYEAAFSTSWTDGSRFTTPRLDLPQWVAGRRARGLKAAG